MEQPVPVPRKPISFKDAVTFKDTVQRFNAAEPQAHQVKSDLKEVPKSRNVKEQRDPS